MRACVLSHMLPCMCGCTTIDEGMYVLELFVSVVSILLALIVVWSGDEEIVSPLTITSSSPDHQTGVHWCPLGAGQDLPLPEVPS